MRPLGLDHDYRLRLAAERAAELQRDWRSANRRIGRRPASAGPALAAVVRGARSAAGQTLIGIGSRLSPRGAEPCS